MSSRGYIAVDLDGTIAEYDHGNWKGPEYIGAPIPLMLERVKKWLIDGEEVRIFTARVYPIMYIHPDDRLAFFVGANERETQAAQAAIAIQNWCQEHLGTKLPITCCKDYQMKELWDDRAVQVVPNTGVRADGELG